MSPVFMSFHDAVIDADDAERPSLRHQEKSL